MPYKDKEKERAAAREYNKRRRSDPEYRKQEIDAAREYRQQYYAENRERILARERARYHQLKTTPEYQEQRRKRELKHDYGMTQEQYRALSEMQGGKCAICRRKRKLVVDHCHKTGAVRGLLCSACNLGLGNLSDNAAILRRAAAYLDAAMADQVKLF